ncbi:hypothetical protein [Streptomyces sp. NPDC018321]|uniref:hypothetical protein n=1 Tax=unclassified Streptomyces TaxID=2593676 RepID=UPI0037A43C29
MQRRILHGQPQAGQLVTQPFSLAIAERELTDARQKRTLRDDTRDRRPAQPPEQRAHRSPHVGRARLIRRP